MSDTAPTTELPPETVTAEAAPPRASNDLVLVIGGREWSGWQSIAVTRGVEIVPGSFTLTMTERFPGIEDIVVRPGDACEVRLGNDLVLTGFVDRYAPAIDAHGHKVTVMGRGKCQDLVDCAAVFPDGGTQLASATPLTLATRLAVAYNITVSAPDGDGIAVPQFNAQLGETTFEIVERITRHSGFLAYEGTDGNLILARVGSQQMASGFRQGENIERADVAFSMDQRFSEYQVVLMSSNLFGDVAAAAGGNPGWNSQSPPVPDAGVPRFRRRIIVTEQTYSGVDLARQRAEWEKGRRYGRSQAVKLTCDSWRDSAGKLWEINTKAAVHIPALKLEARVWVIAEVTYRRDESGTHADLMLMPEEAFQPEPLILQPFDSQVFEALSPHDPVYRNNPRLGEGPGQ